MTIVTARTYDASGRVTSESVGGNVTTTIYDGTGNVLSTTDPDGKRLSYAYDRFGRVTGELHSAASGATIKNTTRTLDSLGRVRTETSGSGRTVAYGYPADAVGNTTAAITYDAVTTTLTIDPKGLETTRASAGPGVSLSRSVGARDIADRETSLTVGVAGWGSAYDEAGRLAYQWGSGLSDTKPGSPTYAYDDGRKIAESLALTYGGTRTASYAYTLEGRLATATVGATSTRYAYDTAGNLKTATSGTSVKTLAYDASNRLTSIALTGQVTRTVGWDTNNGWRVRQGPQANPGETTFSYTGTGRLATFDTSAVAGIDGTYTYDAAGQRIRSVVRDASSRTTTTTWSYEGLELQSLAAARSDGATWSITYLDDAAGRPYAGIYRESGRTTPVAFTLLATDHGDVVSLLDSQATPFASYRYDAWGNPLVAGTSSRATTAVADAALADRIATRQVVRYAGYAWDVESQMYYCSARHYDPATMQFLTKDPAGADGEESAYQYCGGDPVGKVDPSGLWWVKYRFQLKRDTAAAWNLYPRLIRMLWKGGAMLSVVESDLRAMLFGNIAMAVADYAEAKAATIHGFTNLPTRWRRGDLLRGEVADLWNVVPGTQYGRRRTLSCRVRIKVYRDGRYLQTAGSTIRLRTNAWISGWDGRLPSRPLNYSLPSIRWI